MKTWDYYGKQDPYYGVLSAEEFRSETMTEQARERFFESGVQQVEWFISLAQVDFGPMNYGTALDYGCGVGRLSRALSDRFKRVIAVDISQGMLNEARLNLAGRENVTFEHAESMSADRFDFLISKVVFQHIPPSQGLEILERLAHRLTEKGVGVIDFPIEYTGGLVRRALRLLHSRWPFGEPIIPMYEYALDRIESALRNGGVRQVRVKKVPAPLFVKAIVSFER